MPDVGDIPQENPMSDERARRIEALRTLAQSSEPQLGAPGATLPAHSTPTPTQPPTARRSRKALLLAALSALVVVVVAAGLIARAILSSPPVKQQQQTSATRVFDPKADNLSCPMDVSWSPDGKTLALLGYQQNCPTAFPSAYAYHPGIIVLYDQATGKATNTIQPDLFIASALQLKPPKIATPDPYAGTGNKDTSQQVIDYAHLLWSPDGKQLAVTFSVLLTTKELGGGGFLTQSIEGVLLVSPSGGDKRVLSHAMAKGEFYSGLWNLATGAYIPATTAPRPPNPANNGWSSMPPFSQPALEYQWDSDGRLQPVTLLTGTRAPAAQGDTSIGQPDGGKTFSVWQPGYVRLVTQLDSNTPTHAPHTLKTPVELWATSLNSWSADGNYLYAGDQGADIANWRIALPDQPAPDTADLAALGLAGAPVLPMRDAGLAAILRRYHDISVDPNAWATQVNLAWSPDGTQVAVQAPIERRDGTVRLSDFAVSVYDCASGKLLKTLTPNLQLARISPAARGYGPTVYLRWSPDSKQLLLYYPLLTGAQIWGSKDLPH